MEICREEGDSKGTLKFLVQHTSAVVHLPPPPLRNIAASHVPPVLPYQESYHPPSSKGHSPHSVHESMSSTSESRVQDGHAMTGYDGSVSDDMDQYEKDRQRHTMRPPPQQISYSQVHTGYSTSPLEQRRRNASVPREPSPTSRRGISPPRTQPNETFGPSQSSATLSANDRGKLLSVQNVNEGSYSNGQTSSNTPLRRTHAHTGSDAAAERERLLELSERQASEREYRVDRERDMRVKERRKGNGNQEPWVLVPSANPRDRPSTANSARSQNTLSRPIQHAPSNSHSGPYNLESRNASYSYPRLPFVPNQLPNPPRHPPPPIPSTSSSRVAGQAVPRNWAIKHVADQEQRTLQPPKSPSRWLSTAKSAGDLRALNGGGPSSRRPSQYLPRALLVGQKETPSALSSGSFINMDPPGRELRDNSANSPGLPRSYDTMRNIPFSPTNYTNTRSTGINAGASQADYNSSGTRFPTHSNSSTPSHLITGNGPWKGGEEMYPRPHSALDDIGASPSPYRPSPSNGSWVDVESALDGNDVVRSPQRATSPQHPYATANARPSPPVISSKLAQASLRQGFSLQGSINLSSDPATKYAEGGTSTTLRSPRGMANPESPRRALNDRRDVNNMSQSIMGAATSFVPLSQESPTQEPVCDESSGTLKADEHSYLVPMISGTLNSEGTVRPEMFHSRSSPTDRSGASTMTPPLSVPKSADVSARSVTDVVDPYAFTFVEDDDDDDDDEGTNLWKTPLKPLAELNREIKRPVLSVETDSDKRLGVYDGSSRDYQQPPSNNSQTIISKPSGPPNYQPVQRQRKTAANNSKRDSEFIKKSVQTWAFRSTLR